MSRVFFGLSSTEGDRLGHLVRGVQMLRSYGHEAEIERYSAVVNVPLLAEEPPALICVVSGQAEATWEGLLGICRETEWALGDQPEILQVWLLQHGSRQGKEMPRPLTAIVQGQRVAGGTQVLSAAEFERLCDWGQQTLGAETDIMGEWPSATGR